MKQIAFLILFFLFVSVTCAQQNLGTIDFPATGKEAAQPHFLRGVLLLHSFEYPDAREAFEEAIKLDPDFVMAYWGAAMTHTHPIWMEQNLQDARAILNKLDPSLEERQKKATTAREKAWLATVEVLYGEGTKEERDLKYEKAMAELANAYSNDLEASVFHALSVLGTAHQGRDFRIYMKAAGILEEAYQKAPNHPGILHYMIHCYDDPVHATLGLRPARKYA
ncbi:tetratricopeptide repeat protein, partial [bacterium]|nr:tetratricopeptide repeat protein [bacterium]